MDLKTMKTMVSGLLIAILAGLVLGCKPYRVAQRETVIKDSLYIAFIVTDIAFFKRGEGDPCFLVQLSIFACRCSDEA